MSKARRAQRIQDSIDRHLPPRRKGHCRWCGTEVVAPRRSWCSDACVAQHDLLTNPSTYRPYVFARAGGRCQLCNVDLARRQRLIDGWTNRLAPILWSGAVLAPRARVRVVVASWHAVTETGRSLVSRRFEVYEPEGRQRARQEAARRLVRVLKRLRIQVGRSCWEVDHVEALADGGSHCLSNLRLLCCACHRGVSAAQVAQRSQALQ